jgi:hypothetical protein
MEETGGDETGAWENGLELGESRGNARVVDVELYCGNMTRRVGYGVVFYGHT